jgi:hypothetical protein
MPAPNASVGTPEGKQQIEPVSGVLGKYGLHKAEHQRSDYQYEHQPRGDARQARDHNSRKSTQDRRPC